MHAVKAERKQQGQCCLIGALSLELFELFELSELSKQ